MGQNWVEAGVGQTAPVLNPATEEQIGAAAAGAAPNKGTRATAEAFRQALTIAAEASLSLGAAIREAADEVIDLECRASPPLAGICNGVQVTSGGLAEYIAFSAVYLKRVPIGVCAVITPWNVPLMMGGMVVPADRGNTVVLKPASVNSCWASVSR